MPRCASRSSRSSAKESRSIRRRSCRCVLALERMGAGSESDFAELKRRVRDAGLLQRQPSWYALSIGINALLLCLCLVCLARFQLIWFQVLAGIVLAFVSGQLAFQVHDAGHNQMFARTRL